MTFKQYVENHMEVIRIGFPILNIITVLGIGMYRINQIYENKAIQTNTNSKIEYNETKRLESTLNFNDKKVPVKYDMDNNLISIIPEADNYR